MTETELQKLRFPIGEFQFDGAISESDIEDWIQDIAELPKQLHLAFAGLDDAQLDTPYRPGGWTISQVVHHIGDSHMNSFIRFKLALTEDRPTIKPYREDRWAELEDYRNVPLPVTLDLISALHAHWVVLLRSLTPDDLKREFLHPNDGPIQLGRNIGIYAWHGKHHVAHITSLRKRMNW